MFSESSTSRNTNNQLSQEQAGNFFMNVFGIDFFFIKEMFRDTGLWIAVNLKPPEGGLDEAVSLVAWVWWRSEDVSGRLTEIDNMKFLGFNISHLSWSVVEAHSQIVQRWHRCDCEKAVLHGCLLARTCHNLSDDILLLLCADSTFSRCHHWLWICTLKRKTENHLL